MPSISNQYAAKVFSEHPIATWPLDDPASYISLLSDSQKNISDAGWTKTKCTVSQITNLSTLPSQGSPFKGESNYYEVNGISAQITSPSTKMEVILQNAIQSQSLNEDLKTLFFNVYVFQQSTYTSSYEIGYRYYDSVANVNIEKTKTFNSSLFQEWINLSETFDVTEFDADSLSFFIRFYVNPGGGSGDYKFIVHGLSVGQWSEIFASEDTGVYPQSLPTSIGIGSLTGIAADQYGPLSENAYYVCDNGRLLAQNEGVPMVFGSKNSTRIYPNTNKPGLVFPGKGLLAERGRYQSFSLEFWLKIKPLTKHTRRIVGPIDSDYGIYVSEGFISLVVGNKIASHNIGEWYRPMLVHLIYTPTKISLLVNSEKIAEIEIDAKELTLPENEWFGFYSYSDIEVFEIDCVSIMSYVIPLPVAKRRFVWGQGVDSQELIDASYKGKSTSVSFSNANYSTNIVYPDKERWDAGYYDNVVANTKYLSIPEYSLPQIYLSGRSTDSWYLDNKVVNTIEYPSGNHEKFITFRPNYNDAQTTWSRASIGNWTEKCYIQFSSSNILSSPFNTFYGVFEVEEDIATVRPLIHIVNSLTGKRFEINIQGLNVSYIFDGETVQTFSVSAQNHFVVGMHIPTFINSFGPSFASFFSSLNSLQFYIGGSPDTNINYNTFEAKIYKFAVADSASYSLIENEFLVSGITNIANTQDFLDHSSMYSVTPFLKYNRFFLDISVYSTWEEYFPLTYFAQYVDGYGGKQYYDVDFLQFNFGYPSYIEKTNSSIQNNPWDNYAELDSYYALPIQRTYEELDNFNLTGFADYEDLDLNITSKNIIDTSKSSIQSFATFQLLAEGSDEPLSSFIYTKILDENKVVDASQESTISDPYKPYKTKFSIVDGSIIYPPRNISIENVSLNIHFIIKQDAILSNPLLVRDLEISSKALSRTKTNPIGTKFSGDITPYVKSGIYYSYKSKNPYSIFKKNMPYLYLTENSGIRMLQFGNYAKEYASEIKINQEQEQNFYLGAVQMFIKYEFDELPSAPVNIFEIEYRGGTVEFLAERDPSGLRSKIFARDKDTKTIFENISYYQNGIKVESPYISYNQWNVLGVMFDIPLDLTSYSGSLNIFAGATYNNISCYRAEGLNLISSVVARIWQSVLNDGGPSNYDWRYWYDRNQTEDIQTWRSVYELASNQYYSLSAKDIYNSYAGTNVNVFDDDTGISIDNDVSVVISDVRWSSLTQKPA